MGPTLHISREATSNRPLHACTVIATNQLLQQKDDNSLLEWQTPQQELQQIPNDDPLFTRCATSNFRNQINYE